MKARIELLEILVEAVEDVKYGRVAPVKDTFVNKVNEYHKGRDYEDLSEDLEKNVDIICILNCELFFVCVCF